MCKISMEMKNGPMSHAYFKLYALEYNENNKSK